MRLVFSTGKLLRAKKITDFSHGRPTCWHIWWAA